MIWSKNTLFALIGPFKPPFGPFLALFDPKRPLSTLQLLILATGAHFQAVLSTFEGKFATFLKFDFWFVAPLSGRHGRMGSAGSPRGANLDFFQP